MVIVPSSNIILLKTPMELSDNNQLTWTNKTEQYNYFYNLPRLELNEATYQRKEGVIRFPTSQTITYEDLIQYNYCMYQNEAYDNKWFYAYITDISYINDGMSTIKLETDVWNTWCFDLDIKKSFVEREHVNDDTIGKHTIPEGLETGEYICSNIDKIDLGILWYVIGATRKYDSTPQWARGGGIYNGIYSGKTYYAVRTSADVDYIIDMYDSAGYGEDISEIFIVPAKLIGNPTYDPQNPIIKVSQSSAITELNSITLTRPSTIDTYTPKNNKLLTYPYQYILVDNNGGNSVDYRYELFNNGSSCKFSVIGALTIGTSMTLLPISYVNSNGNPTEAGTINPNMANYGISLAKFPTCNWNTDLYTNWVTQNALNMAIAPVSGFTQGVLGGVSKGSAEAGLFSGSMNALSAVSNNLTERYAHSFSPFQSKGNANSGDVITSGLANAPHLYKMNIKKEYAQIIDDFFSMFGYKVNSLKIPNIRGRLNWNYVKTANCNITGDIPQLDLEKIKKQFDNGVTFWHHANTFLDYSQSNTIVS